MASPQPGPVGGSPVGGAPIERVPFVRDRLTWVAYLLLGWFSFLQASPGLVMPYLRDELGLSYSVGGLHVAAFAAGSLVGGIVSGRLEIAVGRRAMLWSGAALMAGGTVGLAAGGFAHLTIASVLVMGFGAGLLLVAIQALLADRHGERRAVALTEANVAASVGYVLLIGALSLAAALAVGWRFALLAALAVPFLLWSINRRLEVAATSDIDVTSGSLSGIVWVAGAMLFCTTAAEWSVIAWGASFIEGNARVSADTAVGLMGGYFVGVVAGRIIGSRLARSRDAARLLAISLAVALVGFASFWLAAGPVQAVLGLVVVGIGIGNLYPLGTSVTLALAPGQAAAASGRAVAMSAAAGLLAPLIVGPLADAASLSAALLVIPAFLGLAGLGLALVVRRQPRLAPAAP
jgi:MFS family permease